MCATCEKPKGSSPAADPQYHNLLNYEGRYECPFCQSAIPVDGVLRHDQTDAQAKAGVVQISALCPACDRGAQSLFAPIDGIYHRRAAIHPIDDQALLDTLRAGLDLARGDRQVRHTFTASEMRAARDELRDRRARHVPAEPSAAAVRAEPTAREMEERTLDAALADADLFATAEQGICVFVLDMLGVVRTLAPGRTLTPRLQALADVARDRPPATPTPPRRPTPPAAGAGESFVLDAAVADQVGSPARPEPTIDTSTSQVEERPAVAPLDANKFAELRRAKLRKT